MAKKPEEKPKQKVKPKTKAKAKKKLPLVKVSEETAFWCNDGRVFRDLRELAEGLASMSNETFYYHVTQERNDFSNWIGDVMEDMELAGLLRKMISKEEASACIISRLEIYE